MRGPAYQKRLGQHHLRHPELCRPMLDFLRPEGARVVEIGPGGGALTGLLLERAAAVVAWEADPAWAFALRRRLPAPTLALVVGDALELPWERLPPGTPVTGNLPYNIATRLILDLLGRAARVPRAAFLVQREVASRLLAGPGDSDYGSLSVLRRARADAVLLGRVKRTSFRPPPKVDGALVGLTPRPAPLPEAEMAGFEATVRLAFSSRRKTLRNALAGGWGRAAADRLLADLGCGPRTRAGELALEDFARLYRARREAAKAAAAGPAARE